MDTPEINATQLRYDLFKACDDGLQIFRSLATCTDRLTYAGVRFHDIQDVIQEKITPNFEEWRNTGDVDEPEGVFHQSQWQIRMLATEAVQHLHSVFDPLACAIYWFNVPINERQIEPRDLSFYKVRTCPSVAPKYRKKLANIASTDSFFHLTALSNLSKHSQIVHPALQHWNINGSPTDAESAMVFEACHGTNRLNKARGLSEDVVFPSTSISFFLRDELQRIAPLFNELAGLIRSDLDSRLKAEKL